MAAMYRSYDRGLAASADVWLGTEELNILFLFF